MNKPAERALEPFSFERVEVFDLYDQPLLYVGHDPERGAFLAWIWDLDTSAWLFAPVSPQRLSELRSGAVDLRSAFLTVKGGRVLRRTGEPAVYDWIDAGEIDQERLPMSGDLLGEPMESF